MQFIHVTTEDTEITYYTIRTFLDTRLVQTGIVDDTAV